MGEMFSEETIDGRLTVTTPIRNGNIIIFDQKGSIGRNEKDTQMVREFTRSADASPNGPFDLMLITMLVDDVVCRRSFTRISEDVNCC